MDGTDIVSARLEPWMGRLFLFLLWLFDEKRTGEYVPSPGPCALACRLGKELHVCCFFLPPSTDTDCSFISFLLLLRLLQGHFMVTDIPALGGMMASLQPIIVTVACCCGCYACQEKGLDLPLLTSREWVRTKHVSLVM